MAKFELISKYAGHEELLPRRGTANSAGYDFIVAEDITVPSYFKDIKLIDKEKFSTKILSEAKNIFQASGFHPTLVPTGIKCALAQDEYLSIVARSSTPLKYWLIVANAPGTVDADYYNNASNEGHIFIQLINLSPFDIRLQKGDKVAQGIIQHYTVTEDDAAIGERMGGFGSTTK